MCFNYITLKPSDTLIKKIKKVDNRPFAYYPPFLTFSQRMRTSRPHSITDA